MSIRVFPECDTLECSKAKFDKEAERKSTGREYDQLMVRHWDTWSDHARNHLFVAQLENGKLGKPVDVTKGLDTETPPKPFSGMEEVTFSPDGKYIVYSAKHRVKIRPGPPTTISGKCRSQVARPRISPKITRPGMLSRCFPPMAAICLSGDEKARIRGRQIPHHAQRHSHGSEQGSGAHVGQKPGLAELW